MSDDSTFDNTFPRFHSNDVTETESKGALQSALPRNKLLLHEETNDRGVDYSLEVVDQGFDKNFRAQIQLKGTRTIKPLRDGSYSLAVETSNINHLLNGPISVYFLYVKATSEIRFAWTWDERDRIERKNPDWIKQESVTLRFSKTLSETTAEEIRQRIMAHGKAIRVINENISSANPGHVSFEIDRETFEVTDLKRLREIIETKGIGICILGNSDWVLEKVRLFTKEERTEVKIRIVEAVAYFEKASYQRARECISTLRLHYPNLSREDRVLTEFVKVHCDAETGRLEFLALTETLRALADENVKPLPYDVRASYLRKAIFAIDDEAKRYDGSNEKERRKLFEQLRTHVNEKASRKANKEIELRNEFTLLSLEGELISLEGGADISAGLLAIGFGTERLSAAIIRQNEKIREWEVRVGLLLTRPNNPQFFADLVCQKAYLFFLGWSRELLLQRHSGYGSELNVEEVEQFQEQLQSACTIYEQSEMIYQKLRAQIWLAGFHFISGRLSEFKGIQESVISTADDLNLIGIKEEALSPLYVQAQSILNREEDVDERGARLDDRTIEVYAEQRMNVFDLPRERLPNIRLSLQLIRDRAIEHLEWCKSLDIREDERHMAFPSTMYGTNPSRDVVCSRHGYESKLTLPDWRIIAADFKTTFCENCSDRQPKRLR